MFYLCDLENFKFVFDYKANGNDVKVVASIENDEVLYNGNSIGVVDADIEGCEDYDDVGIVIGKRLIQDSDSDVVMEVIPSSDKSFSSYKVQLNQQLDYKTDLVDDCTLTLSDIDYSVEFIEIYDVEDPDKIIDIFDDGDEDGFYDWMDENEGLEVYQQTMFYLFDEGPLGYALEDASGNEITEGDLTIVDCENNFDYKAFSYEFAEKDYVHSKYILMKIAHTHHSCCSFSVPKDFNVNGIHLINSHELEHFYVEDLPDRILYFDSFRYNGKLYESDCVEDCGQDGFRYYLLKWNDDDPRHPHYDVVAQRDDD